MLHVSILKIVIREIINIKTGIKEQKAKYLSISVAARSKAWVCGRLLAGIASSNPAGRMDVCLLCVVCCVLSGKRSLRWADHSSRGGLPSASVVRCQVEVSALA
jgi:hypothetical protein